MNAVFDYFLKKETPSFILCNPNKEPIASLGLGYNKKNILRYNALSELEFDFPKSVDNNVTTLEAYSLIHNKMLVLVDGVGYYLIVDCPEDSTGMIPVKKVSCQSLETELINRRLTKFSGTFNLYNSATPKGTLLDTILGYFPGWTMGYVDPLLENVYRTFDSNNSTIYKFLTTDVESAYSCVFTFNTFYKTVSVYAIESLNTDTDIYLSFNNINKSVTLSEFSDEVTTALYCYGKDNLDIHGVNPLGKNVIYDFSYYETTDWMSQDLIDALTLWEAKVSSQQVIYASTLTTVKTNNESLITMKSDLNELKSQLASYNNIYEVRKEQKLSTVDVEVQIHDQNVSINTKNEEIAVLQNTINGLESNLRKITSDVQFTTKTSLENLYYDVSSIITDISDISSNWQTIYFPTSVNPALDVEQLNDSTAEIIEELANTTNFLSGLYVKMGLVVEAYPPSSGDIDYINQLLNDILLGFNSLYILFSGLIPNTDTTIRINTDIVLLQSYYDILDYVSNFTDDQYEKLQSFMYENTYTNANIITTDIMTQEEVQTQSQALYDQGKKILARTSQPRFELEGDFVNVLGLPEYTTFINQMDLGRIATIEIDETHIIEAALLEIELTYDNPTEFRMIFSNRVRLNSSNFIFADMFSDSAEKSSSVGGITGGNSSTITSGNIIPGNSILSLTNAEISALGYISFGITPPKAYGNAEGVWIGYNVGAQASFYSNANNYLQWDGTKLLVRGENFTLDSQGNITATNATLSGEITAETGDIGGWTISASSLYSGSGVTFVAMDSSGSAPAFYAGSDDSATAPFRVYNSGLLVANNATITGSIVASSGSFGGWTIDSNRLYSGSIILNSATPAMLIGGATDYLVGSGVFIGSNSGAYKMHIGNPSGNYISWDGSILYAGGQWITSTATNLSLQKWTSDIVFSSSGSDLVSWTAGSIVMASGIGYAITSGSTGAMSSLTYIYFDTAVSSTVLQHSTIYSTAVGDGKILISTAQNNTNGASVIAYSGQQPIINGAQITALSILAGNIAAATITANKLNISTLSAITASMGNLTIDEKLTLSGINSAITIGTTPPTSSGSGTGIWVDRHGIYGLNAGQKMFTLLASDGSGTFASGKAMMDADAFHLTGLSNAMEFYSQTLDTGLGRLDRTGTIGMQDIANEVSFNIGYWGQSASQINTNSIFDGADDATRKRNWSFAGGADLVASTEIDPSGYCVSLPAGGSIRLNETSGSFVAYPGYGYLIKFYCKVGYNIKVETTFTDALGGGLGELIKNSSEYGISDWHEEKILLVAPPRTTIGKLIITSASATSYIDSIFIDNVLPVSQLSFEPSPIFRGSPLGFEETISYPPQLDKFYQHNMGAWNNRLWLTTGAGVVNDMIGVPKPNMKRLPMWVYCSNATVYATGTNITETGTSTAKTDSYKPENGVNFITAGGDNNPAGWYGDLQSPASKVIYGRFRCGWKDNSETYKIFQCGFSNGTFPFGTSAPFYDTSEAGIYFMLLTDAADVYAYIISSDGVYTDVYTFTAPQIASAALAILFPAYFDIELVLNNINNTVTVNIYDEGVEVPALTVTDTMTLQCTVPLRPYCQISATEGAAKEFTFYRAYCEYSTEPDDMIASDPISVTEDTFIDLSTPTTNYGASVTWRVGEGDSDASLARGLIRWGSTDFDAYKTKIIIAAYLYVYVISDASSGTRVLNVYRCLKDWVEGEATWNKLNSTTDWATAGGGSGTDYDGTIIGQITLAATPSPGWYRFSLDADLFTEFIVNTGGIYHGFFLKGVVENADRYRFDSLEGTGQPSYIVIYTRETGTYNGWRAPMWSGIGI